MKGGQKAELARVLKAIHQKDGPQVNVLTVSSLNEVPIERASIQVAKDWGLGSKTADNGVLLLVSKGDRKVRIEVGQGLEGNLTDAYSRRIIDYQILPAFKQGEFGVGIIAGVRGILLRMDPPIHLEDYLKKEYVPKNKSQNNRSAGFIRLLFMLIFLFFLFTGRGGRGGFLALLLLSGMGRGGGGGFGGGGGWSGGGGGFSGGGASGSW